MSTPVTLDQNIIGLGNQVLNSLRISLSRELGDRAAACLQEAGYAAGEQVYDCFLRWLPEFTGVDDPKDLDASTLGEVLSAFFQALGWGPVSFDRTGKGTITITANRWAEAVPGAGAQQPSCFVSSGLLTDFLGRLSLTPVAVMEVECMTRGDGHCRFVAGAPETMDELFDALAAGRGYQEVLDG